MRKPNLVLNKMAAGTSWCALAIPASKVLQMKARSAHIKYYGLLGKTRKRVRSKGVQRLPLLRMAHTTSARLANWAGMLAPRLRDTKRHSPHIQPRAMSTSRPICLVNYALLLSSEWLLCACCKAPVLFFLGHGPRSPYFTHPLSKDRIGDLPSYNIQSVCSASRFVA